MEARFISQPRRMMALGCASEIALAAASNSASCRPSATSLSGVPFTVSGTDQTTLRSGLSFFQMPGTQLNRVKSSHVFWAYTSTPTTDVGAWLSHFSQLCNMRSRPTGPQLTNAPASLDESDAARDA